MYLQDDENTMMYSPADMSNNKFFGTWSRLTNLTESLNYEQQSKYNLDYEAYYRSKLEIGSAPICFDQCVNNVNQSAGLNSDEKNCVRECFLKRIASKEDFSMLLTQKTSRENVRGVRDTF